jgi:23S rRNA (cytidine1920-2'-O)/16S rRNA (cytidine1409-2'-O)-methyltransferase
MHKLGLAESRNKARELILGGYVTVDGRVQKKPSASVPEGASIEVLEEERYVGRGGYKLETALEEFELDFTDKTCLDAGAGAGGFTDLMLQNGAARVYAVDVGEAQLHERLRANPKVVNMEKQDIRKLKLPEQVDFITADLSFISLKKTLPGFKAFMNDKTECVVLIKPQFEAGREKVGKGGVVRSSETHLEVLEAHILAAEGFGYYVKDITFSPLKGPKGNIEFLSHLIAGAANCYPQASGRIDLKAVADAAHEVLI